MICGDDAFTQQDFFPPLFIFRALRHVARRSNAEHLRVDTYREANGIGPAVGRFEVTAAVEIRVTGRRIRSEIFPGWDVCQVYKFMSGLPGPHPQGLCRLACGGYQPTLLAVEIMLPHPKSPRPILKQASSTFGSSIRSARVHFPPSPRLSTFQFTHSPQFYDRSPLIVQPNVCALPGRGERVYLAEDNDNATQDDIIPDSIPLRDGHFQPEHPRDAPAYPHTLNYPSSSTHPESDESDGSLATPPDLSNIGTTPLIVTHPSDILGPSLSRRRSDSDTLSFLPHPPSPEKPKRPKRALKRAYSDKHLFGCTFSEDKFSTPAFEGCLGGF